MHPAVSVIFFTVTSGAGFGLIGIIGLGLPTREGMLQIFLAAALAGGLAIAGLLTSTFHLGHPERAIRAFSQWRSSWLSREGVAAVATLVLFGIYVLLWMFGNRLAPLGWLVALLSIVTIFTTAMIYTQLKTIPHWRSWLTPVCYLAFAIASALVLAGVVAEPATLFGYPLALLAIAAIAGAWVIKMFWWLRADKVGFSQTGSDTGTATGLGHLGDVKLLERPHSGENYLTREMVHVIGRKHATRLRQIALLAGCIIPLLLCALSLFVTQPMIAMIVAATSMFIGLFAERWLFFAEAKHSVSLYY